VVVNTKVHTFSWEDLNSYHILWEPWSHAQVSWELMDAINLLYILGMIIANLWLGVLLGICMKIRTRKGWWPKGSIPSSTRSSLKYSRSIYFVYDQGHTSLNKPLLKKVWSFLGKVNPENTSFSQVHSFIVYWKHKFYCCS